MKLFTVWMLLLLAVPLTTVGQLARYGKRTNVWYFGQNAGVDFNGGAPRTLMNSAMSSPEGSSVISDDNGNLLLYTNGQAIWNRNHKVIPNGQLLGGSASASQSSLIVPQPGKSNIYYVFTVDVQGEPAGVRYTVVDIRQNGGLGGIVSKSNKLYAPSTEKLTAALHCNMRDYWIITHEVETNNFRVYLLSDKGLNETPVVSSVGTPHVGFRNYIGYMKASPNSRKVALALYEQGVVEVFDFDNETGQLSNPLTITNRLWVNGIEFSPSSQVLYSSVARDGPWRIYQYDLSKTTSRDLFASEHIVADIPLRGGALQNGPDGKIYFVMATGMHLSTIGKPDKLGEKCEFEYNTVDLNGRSVSFGLPNFIPSYFRPKPKVKIAEKRENNCKDVVLKAEITDAASPGFDYEWLYNGTPLDSANFDTHKPKKPGKYKLIIKEKGVCPPDTAHSQELNVIVIEANPKVILKGCGQKLLQANAAKDVIVRWTGPGIDGVSKQDSLRVSGQNGTVVYKLGLSSPNDTTCIYEQDIPVTFVIPPDYSFGEKSRVACGDSSILNAASRDSWEQFVWMRPDSSTSNGAKLEARTNGTYHLLAKSPSTGCESRDSVTIRLSKLPAPPVVTAAAPICEREAMPIMMAQGEKLQWYSEIELKNVLGEGESFKPTASTERTDTLRYFAVQRNADNCPSRPTSAQVIIKPGVNLKVESRNLVVCFKDGRQPVTLDVGNGPYWTFDWRQVDTGTTSSGLTGKSPTLTVDRVGRYAVAVTNDWGCTARDTIKVEESCTPGVFIPTAFSPNGDGVNDTFEIKGSFIEKFDLKVFNRWGTAIFSLEGATLESAQGQFWDGRYQGQPVDSGVYAYQITVWGTASSSVNRFTKTGTVMVVR